MIDDPAFKVLMANAEAIKRGALSLWTIYEKPLDHPDGFLARRFERPTTVSSVGIGAYPLNLHPRGPLPARP
jgi:hypothetical protein